MSSEEILSPRALAKAKRLDEAWALVAAKVLARVEISERTGLPLRKVSYIATAMKRLKQKGKDPSLYSTWTEACAALTPFKPKEEQTAA